MHVRILTISIALFLALHAKSPELDPLFIGVQVVPLEEINEESRGFQITAVTAHSPADKAGIQKDWVIFEINGVPIPAQGAIDRLKDILTTLRVGEKSTWKASDTNQNIHDITLTPISQRQWQVSSTRRLARRIAENVENLRGLKKKKNIDTNVMNREELYNFLKDDYRRELIESDLKKGELILSRLGLQPEGIDSVALTLELLKGSVLGFYHPKTKQLILIEGQSGETAETSMAHELTHALQDQHFRLEFMLQQIQENSDLATALRCVTEGDAKLLELEYLKAIQNKNEDSQWLTKELPGGSHIPPTQNPRLRYLMMIEKELMYPYLSGTRFVKEAHKRGGWDAVNRLFYDWPRSTEQIIHPEKYFDKREDPIEIEVHEFVDWADQDYEVLLSDVMGELGTIRLFLNFVDRKTLDAEAVGAGWDGDRLIGLIRAKDQKPVILWLSLWESEEDAQEFADALTLIYQERFQKNKDLSSDDIIAVENSSADDIIAVDGPITTILKRQKNRVIFCDGASENEARSLIKKLLEDSKVIHNKKSRFWELGTVD